MTKKETKITTQEARQAHSLARFLSEEYFISLNGEETLQELEEAYDEIRGMYSETNA